MDPLNDQDIYLFKQGNHFRLYEKMGSHPAVEDGVRGTWFRVWAPNAEMVTVMGDFNEWNKTSHPLKRGKDDSGVWEGFVKGVDPGAVYKYHIISKYNNYQVDKGDPFAFRWEAPPRTASVVWDLEYKWSDGEWMEHRQSKNSLRAPVSVYEVHLGSWRRVAEEGNRRLTYRELAQQLPEYVKEMGFTHVEFMPVMEHPFYGSWGYQKTGFFAPTSRYGDPQDFMHLVDVLHQNGIGVILDWVPSHFPSDEHGLVYFDGTHLFEHADPRKGYHPDWNSYIFNYGRNEVCAFLISSALFWLDQYHVDGLRVDAVASMLYLDYSRKAGEWEPNQYGERENLEAVEFLKSFNMAVSKHFPGAQTIAEESTAWPMVSRPVYLGGLGFHMKWNMGWMHDTLDYFKQDPVYRSFYHNSLTFSIWYAFSENFMLSLSHDEVVHMKGSLINKMSGDVWQKAASLRAMYGYMYGHPGKKLLFMGSELAQWKEWNHDAELDWGLLDHPLHRGIRMWVRDLNRFYQSQPALYELDFHLDGFEWMDFHDWERSIISYVRKGKDQKEIVLVVCNFTPVPRFDYQIAVPREGFWREMLDSDAEVYGGAGYGNYGGVETSPVPAHGKPHSLRLTLPPLSVLFFKHEAPVEQAGEVAVVDSDLKEVDTDGE